MSALSPEWRTSSYSNNGASCVEVRLIGNRIEVRDTKLGEDSPVLGFTSSEWTVFMRGAQDGEFDL